MDLFTPTKRENRPGEGNGKFLADLAEHVSDEVMRQRFKAGDYEPLHLPSVQPWRALNGRTTNSSEGK